MIIRQEENTPIGNQFHDSGILKAMSKLEGIIDEFEVDTDDVNALCDNLISSLKSLKAITKKAETEYQKRKSQQELKDSIHTYNM